MLVLLLFVVVVLVTSSVLVTFWCDIAMVGRPNQLLKPEQRFEILPFGGSQYWEPQEGMVCYYRLYMITIG